MSSRRTTPLFHYAALAPAVVAGAYALAIRPWHQRWGATTDEIAAAMAGDELVPAPNWKVTRAVTIDAPPAAVWPWLVQMGYGRGGLYTYDWLDVRLGVLDGPSASSVLPQFQNLAVGDTIPIGNDPGWPVAALDRERTPVLDIRRPRLHITWSFLLTSLAGGRTRLVLRYRGLVQPRLAKVPLYALIDAGEFLMTRRMLLGIRTRAERLARRHAAHPRLIPDFTAL